MATSSKVAVILVGENASAVKAINQVGTAAEKNASKVDKTFARSTSKTSKAFSTLDRQLANFGVPFAGALTAVGGNFDKAGGKAQTFGKKLSNIGGGIALGAAAGLALVGGAAVHAALEGEAAQARLETAIKNVGGTYKTYQGQIDDVSKKMADFGFQNDDVSNSIARLIPATHDVGKAIQLQSVAADIAAARGIDLATATDLLVKVEAGRFTQLGRLGLATKDQIKGFKNADDAVKFLSARYQGSAAAAADTYAGKLRALSANVHNLEEELGNKLLPVISKSIDVVLGTVHGFEAANTASGGFLGKVALLATAIPVGVFAIEKLGKAGGAIVGQFGKAANAIALVAPAAAAVAAPVGIFAAGVAAVGAAAIGTGAAFDAAFGELGLKVEPDIAKVKELSAALFGTEREARQAQNALSGIVGNQVAADLRNYSDLLLANADAHKLASAEALINSDAEKQAAVNVGAAGSAADVTASQVAILTGHSAEYQRVLNGETDATDAAVKSLQALKEKYGEAGLQNLELQQAQKTYADLLASGTASENDLAIARQRVVDASSAQSKTQTEVNAATKEGTDASKNNSDALAKQAQKTKDAEDALRKFTDALTGARDAQLGSRSAVLDLDDSLDSFQEKALLAAAAGGKDAKANRDLEKASIDVRQHILNVAEAARRQAEQQDILTGKTFSARDSANAQRGALIKLRDSISPRSPFRAYLDSLIHDLDAAAKSRTGSLDVRVTANGVPIGVSPGGVIVLPDGTVIHNARQHGGPVEKSRSYLVGEKGPELFVPNAAGNIIPNNEITPNGVHSTWGGGGTINVYIESHIDPITGRTIHRLVQDDQAHNGPWKIKIRA